VTKVWVVPAIACIIGCSRSNFDKDIVGTWRSSGVPASTALPEELRRSADWDATLEFKPDGSFAWELDAPKGGSELWGGTYSVVGYSLEIEVTERDAKPLPSDKRLSYRVRQQATGAIRLPLPQDWAGPSVDYFSDR
jgi:hypothetical protein